MIHGRNSALRLALFAALGVSQSACGSDVRGAGGGGSEPTSNSSTGVGMDPPPATPPPSPCDGATLVLTQDGYYTGFAKCPDGTVHRLEPAPCDKSIPGPSCKGNEQDTFCEKDSDCTDGPNGRCIHEDSWGNLATTACLCEYACAADAECAAGEVCVCKDVIAPGKHSACMTAGCAKSGDCPTGECGLSTFFDGCDTIVDLACRAPADACRLDGDCAPNFSTCAATGDHVWSCVYEDCVSGRPLLVDGSARTARHVARTDWSASAGAPDLRGLDGALRAALAEHWARVAALEHASVASFARFSLELLALGAPPDLLADAQRAGMDEVEHARIAYALASAFEGRPMGPGPIDMRGVGLHVGRHDVIAALVEEACVGETLAAAEAAALAPAIVDPALRAAHERIAEDELRHAALGFRALAWLLEDADEATRRTVERLFERAIAAASRDPVGPRRVSAAHGLCAAAELGDVRRAALREIVRPCLAALTRGAHGIDEEKRPMSHV